MFLDYDDDDDDEGDFATSGFSTRTHWSGLSFLDERVCMCVCVYGTRIVLFSFEIHLSKMKQRNLGSGPWHSWPRAAT